MAARTISNLLCLRFAQKENFISPQAHSLEIKFHEIQIARDASRTWSSSLSISVQITWIVQSLCNNAAHPDEPKRPWPFVRLEMTFRCLQLCNCFIVFHSHRYRPQTFRSFRVKLLLVPYEMWEWSKIFIFYRNMFYHFQPRKFSPHQPQASS